MFPTHHLPPNFESSEVDIVSASFYSLSLGEWQTQLSRPQLRAMRQKQKDGEKRERVEGASSGSKLPEEQEIQGKDQHKPAEEVSQLCSASPHTHQAYVSQESSVHCMCQSLVFNISCLRSLALVRCYNISCLKVLASQCSISGVSIVSTLYCNHCLSQTLMGVIVISGRAYKGGCTLLLVCSLSKIPEKLCTVTSYTH